MNEQTVNDISLFLIHTQAYHKQDLAPQIEQYKHLLETESKYFHDEITRQFERIVRELLADAVGKNLGSNAEDIATVLDGLNIKEYLGEL